MSRYSTEIVADEMQMLDGRPQGQGAPAGAHTPQGQQGGRGRQGQTYQAPPPQFRGNGQPTQAAAADFDDDIPF